MKKTAMGIAAALALTLAVTGTALAANEHEGSTVITTSVDSGFTLTVPANTTIPYMATTTQLAGDLTVRGNIATGQKVTVTATPGQLTGNSSNSVIPYTLQDKGGTEFASEDWSMAEVNAGSKDVDLVVAISEADWNAAAADQYAGTITFRATLS